MIVRVLLVIALLAGAITTALAQGMGGTSAARKPGGGPQIYRYHSAPINSALYNNGRRGLHKGATAKRTGSQ
jgi:hypothetical protein